jgi:hypothetical protein
MSIDPDIVKQIHAQHVMRIYEQSRDGGGSNVALTPEGIARILEDYEVAKGSRQLIADEAIPDGAYVMVDADGSVRIADND